jgi:uncharacterized OB-fold protein
MKVPLEKVTQVGQTKPWYGELSAAPSEPHLYGQYTYGIAGERFFREIKDNARLMGTKCEKCELLYLPPRIYCERCFSELVEWLRIPKRGVIHTFTISYVDLDGNRLEKPIIVALVKFEGVYGGLVHRLAEIEPEEVGIGMPVEIVFRLKAKRIGSILDIDCFRPV